MITSSVEQIGTEILDIDAASISEAEISRIKQLVYACKLIVFRNQNLTTEQYVEFARKIGTLQIYFQDNYHHPDYPEIFVSSNVLEDGKKIGVAGTGRYWHTDCAFQPEPLSWTMLSPQILPKSVRETYYIDMERVYQKLPADLKKYVEGRYAVQEAKWRYKVQEWDMDRAIIDILNDFEQKAPPVTHPTAIVHPVRLKPALYINEGFTTRILGLSEAENQRVLADLFAFIHQEEHIYTHVWQEGDILLWDNRNLIHKASSVPKGESSKSYRIGIYDGLPFYISP